MNLSSHCWVGCLTVVPAAQISWGCEAEAEDMRGYLGQVLPHHSGGEAGATRREEGGVSGLSAHPSPSAAGPCPTAPSRVLFGLLGEVRSLRAGVSVWSPVVLECPLYETPHVDGHQAPRPPRPQGRLSSQRALGFTSESLSCLTLVQSPHLEPGAALCGAPQPETLMHGDPRGSRCLRSPNAFGRTQEAGALEPASPDTAAHGQGVHPEWAPILLAQR